MNKMEWRQIETAPRNGVGVIAGYYDGNWNYRIAFWSGAGWLVACSDAMFIHPTHWMPLPDPPKNT